MAHSKKIPLSLEDLLKSCSSSDYYEEEAQEYLEDKDITLNSHSRESLYRQAWKAGWRPLQKDGPELEC